MRTTAAEHRSSDMVAGEITHLLPSWQLHLRALNRSPKTIETYLEVIWLELQEVNLVIHTMTLRPQFYPLLPQSPEDLT